MLTQEKSPTRKESNKFWKDLIYTKGKISEKKVLNELYEYYFIMNEVPKVYCHVTGNLLSKPNYFAHSVTNTADEYYRKIHLEQFNEFLDDMVKEKLIPEKNIKEIKQSIENYI